MSVLPSSKHDQQGDHKRVLFDNSPLVHQNEHAHCSAEVLQGSPQLSSPNSSMNTDNGLGIDDFIEDCVAGNQLTQSTVISKKQVTTSSDQTQSKTTLKFKPSTKWLPLIKKKGGTETVETIELPRTIKSKRISLNPTSYIPKKLSSLYHPSNNQEVTDSSSKVMHLPNSPKPSKPSKSPNLIPSQLPLLPPMSPNKSSTNMPMLLSNSPTSPTNPRALSHALDRNTSFSSSTPSERSTIGKSINAFKRTTKSILFLESYSAGSISQLSSTDNVTSSRQNSKFDNYVEDYEDDGLDAHDLDSTFEDMPLVRRSISYTDSDRKQIISSILSTDEQKTKRQTTILFSDNIVNDKNKIKTKRNTSSSYMRNELTKELDNRRSPNFEDPNITVPARQRSKTLDNSENPLLGLTNSNNNGLLSSLANFVKINRASSSNLSKTTQTISKPVKIDYCATAETEDPKEFVEHLLSIYPLTLICEILSNEDTEFLKRALQEYLQKYSFENEPLDISLRKFLMLNYLPKETQQIDRVIYQFAKRYWDCNQNLGFEHDTLYILTYSLIMVHTDKFNPNNKRKMTRFDFIQNVLNAIANNEVSSGSKIMNGLIIKELLGYFYDNITYCPLIKISQDQNAYALEALNSKNLPFPYPNLTFLNGSLQTTEYKKPTSNPSSSSSLHHSTSQSLLTTHPQVRKKNSSFLWSETPLLDPYDYIVKNDIKVLDELKLLNNKNLNFQLNLKVPFSSAENITAIEATNPSTEMIENQLLSYRDQLDQDIDTSLLKHVWETLTDSSVNFILKISKGRGSYLVSSNTEINLLNEEANGDEYYLTRVVKVGIIDKQETINVTISPSSVSSASTQIPVPTPSLTDLSPLDTNKSGTTKTTTNNKNKNKIWKPYFCILTSIGMFFYEDVALFRMRFCGKNPKNGRHIVTIEEASARGKNLKELLNNEISNIRTGINNTNESTSFMSFPYFKSEKTESKSGNENNDIKKMCPSFIIGPDSYATRKVQNIEYDEVVNKVNIIALSSLNKSSFKLSDDALFIDLPNLAGERRKSSSDDIISSIEEKITKNEKKSNSCKYTFFIYGHKSKNIYMVSSLTELKSWIYCINSINALNGVTIDYEPLDYTKIPNDRKSSKFKKSKESRYYEVIPIRYLTLTEKLNIDKREKVSIVQIISDNKKNDDVKKEANRARSNTAFLTKTTPSESDIEENRLFRIQSVGSNDIDTFSDNKSITDYDNDEDLINTDKSISSTTTNENTDYMENTSPENGQLSPRSPSLTSLREHKSLENHSDLLEHLYCVKNLTNTMPLEQKTSDELLSSAKILGVQLEWLWYEKCKKETISLILERLSKLPGVDD